MKHSLQLSASFATAAARDAVRQVIDRFLPGKVTWGNLVVESFADRDGSPSLSLFIQFNAKADADALRGLLATDLTSRPWQRGLLAQHECRHDEGAVGTCTPTHEVVK